MSVIGNNILMGAAGQGGGYTIDRSVRLRSSASAYFSRTPVSAGNRKTWTWSGWVKRGTLGTFQPIFACIIDANNYVQLVFDSAVDDTLTIYDSRVTGGLCFRTSAVYRDVSAWYHIVLVADSTNATSSNRYKLYVNGNLITQFHTNNISSISLNSDGLVNSTNEHNLASRRPFGTEELDGYLTEVNFIDGQALDPTSFGEFNEDTGVWQPAKYAGSYGTNGFYLPFSDNTTTTTLAEDASGNGNDWTPNNISLTSGVTYDSMTDTPTPYADGGNYAVLSPLDRVSGGTLADGNLSYNTNSGNYPIRATIAASSGKWYWEVRASGNGSEHGLALASANINGSFATYNFARISFFNGNKRIGGGSLTTYDTSGAATAGDIYGFAADLDNGTLTVYRNNTSKGTLHSWTPDDTLYAPHMDYSTTSSGADIYNFGQRPFAYTPPTGFLPLHTGNLPDSDIVNGREYFNTVLYTGNGTSQSVDGVGFQPDWVWIKKRTLANHALFDVLRGTSKVLRSDTTEAEFTASGVTSFNSDGFSLGSVEDMNSSSSAFVAWNWKANGAGVSNTDGSITSTVSANPTAGFSIVTYTGNGSTSPYPTVGHGLGVAPQLIFTKARSTTSNWVAYTTVIDGSLDFLYLNTTAAKANSGLPTLPTSSVFQVGGPDNNSSGQTHVAYCFSEVEGYSKFGSYTGNGSADGPFIFTNFRPAFVMVKRVNATNNWIMWDNNRSQSNVVDDWLYANLSDAEASANGADFLSNGFKLRNSANAINGAEPYIYMAFAESPFKTSLAR